MYRAFLKFIAYWIDILVTNVEQKVSARTPMLSKRMDLSDYNRDEYFERPELFYDRGTAMPDVTLDQGRTVMGIRIRTYTFASETCSGEPVNDVVSGRLFEARVLHGGTAAPCLIMLHGWREVGVHTFYHWLLGWILARCGVSSVMMTQPYHGRRKPKGTADGDLMLSGDMEQTVGAFRQSVGDVRSLVTWARARYSGPVGVGGFSLGGFVSNLVACVDARIDFAIPLISGGDLIQGMWDSRVGRTIIRDFDAAGVTPDVAAANWRILSAVNFRPKLPPARIQFIAGLFDQLIPPSNVENVVRAWAGPRVLWLPCGHISIAFFGRQMVTTIVGFIRETCGEPATAAARADYSEV